MSATRCERCSRPLDAVAGGAVLRLLRCAGCGTQLIVSGPGDAAPAAEARRVPEAPDVASPARRKLPMAAIVVALLAVLAALLLAFFLLRG